MCHSGEPSGASMVPTHYCRAVRQNILDGVSLQAHWHSRYFKIVSICMEYVRMLVELSTQILR